MGCCREPHDKRLISVSDQIAKDSFALALKSLDKIDVKGLSEKDARYYDLLRIKASDKSYVTHTSDSAILGVIDYYERHRSDRDYPEALYYGGRVYSDLGDYPTAIRYFEKALDNLQSKERDLDLRANVLSQTGRLMNTIRLYKEAVPYLKEAVRIDSMLRDRYNMMYDRQLLGMAYMHLKQFDKADSLFRKCVREARHFDDTDLAEQQMYVAVNYRSRNEIDSALKYIRGIPERVSSVSYVYALAFASRIYYKSGIMDTARMYAEKLVESPDADNKKTGYEILLSSGIVENLPEATRLRLISEYRSDLERQMSRNDSEGAIIQNSWYNYDLHVRERQAAEESRSRVQLWLACAIILCLAALCVIFYIRYRHKKEILRLMTALDNVRRMNSELQMKDAHASGMNPSQDCHIFESGKPDARNLRKVLQDEMLELRNKAEDKIEVSEVIKDSEVYNELKSYVRDGRHISDENPVWAEIEGIVLKASPQFRNRLEMLTGGKLRMSDYRIALLVKCGMTPTEMAMLISRTKGTVSYRREALCERIFGQKLGTKVIDDIIMLI